MPKMGVELNNTSVSSRLKTQINIDSEWANCLRYFRLSQFVYG
jgi:hypothetical protein